MWRVPIPLWLLLGWVLPSVLVFGIACFTGDTINCPSDLLMLPGFHTPADNSASGQVANDIAMMDLIQIAPPAREFMAEEYRNGRIPLWNPYIFCGTPFAIPTKFSPFELLYVAFPVPQTLVWMQLAQNIFIGLGTYKFLRHGLNTTLPSAMFGSALAPFLGFLTVWQGFTGLTAAVCCLPWILWLTDAAFRQPLGRAMSGLAGITAMAVLCGAADITALVLVTSGLRMLWNCCLAQNFDHVRRGVLSATIGWTLGLMIASPFLIPLLQYSGSGARMMERSEGSEERPPVGIEAGWQLIVPEYFGGSRPLLPYLGKAGNMPESSAGAYMGSAALFCSVFFLPLLKGRWQELLFWIPVAILGLSWQLNLPVIVSIERLWPLNMLSWSRWVFITAFSQLVLVSLVFDAFLKQVPYHRSYLRGATIAAFTVAIISIVMYFWPPGEYRTILRTLVERQAIFGKSMEAVPSMLTEWNRGWAVVAVASVLVAVSVLLYSLPSSRKTIACTLLLLAVSLEPIFFARLQRRVAPTDTYFPEVTTLKAMQTLPPGRILGVQCLPPNLAQMWHLRDVRGYDAVDPLLVTRLLLRSANPNFRSPKYARTQHMVPLVDQATDGTMRLPPILNMLNVRYVVLTSEPAVSDKPVLEGDGYWILENQNALPRCFVPKAVRSAKDESALAIMAKPSFDPSAVAFSEADGIRTSSAEGQVTIEDENPIRIRMKAAMSAPGIVVLSDSWSPDWKVSVNGKAAVPLRINTAIRGVEVPAGSHEVVWEYRPASMLRLAPISGISFTVCLAWCFAPFLNLWRKQQTSDEAEKLTQPTIQNP